MCLTNPSNDQLVKDEGAQIFYSIWSQTKPIGIGVNCEIPHNTYVREMTISNVEMVASGECSDRWLAVLEQMMVGFG